MLLHLVETVPVKVVEAMVTLLVTATVVGMLIILEEMIPVIAMTPAVAVAMILAAVAVTPAVAVAMILAAAIAVILAAAVAFS
ncbi:MAG: hypothetical protein RMY16_27495 [Nostoc sp. DedQUE12b]|uniref:hypothetical protein n=1 Tax=unclassified Nostoc TaxID=2593658 RepID=UPI002AD1D207|nr:MULTISPECIES: hypothetical protein [unclassified Nostoc]MDZ7953250.1 hypothetical protein [Nostoc sp. DedQUE09]MDZ8089266.1 hypothetical protein [Nostoc sp. DedQUE12b]